MIVTELFWEASLDEVKRGYIEEEEHLICLFCGRQFEKGVIYPDSGILYEASRYIRIHIQQAHGSVFEGLSHLDKKVTGLSEHQGRLMELFYQGKSDAQIQEEMGIGSSSTIRNHRSLLREKERHAKVFLAMMELLRSKEGSALARRNKKEAGKSMDKQRRKELVQQHKDTEPQAGVYQIRNTTNNKMYIGSTPNLKTLMGIREQLNIGIHSCSQLQKEWNEHGHEDFVFEVLDVLKKKDEGHTDIPAELKKLENQWLNQLQPYGDRGYHRPPIVRD